MSSEGYIHPISRPPGQVVYLAGPSSTGKSTYSSELIANGWMHFEADHFLSVTEIKYIETIFKNQLDVIKNTLSIDNRTPQSILGIIMGNKPEITPDNPQEFDAARALIKTCLDERWTTLGKPDETKEQQIWQEVFIAMLDESIRVSQTGKSVIIDSVGMLGERPEVSAPDLKIAQQKPNIWQYKGIQIEQFLKYAPIDRLAQNIFSRNQNVDNQRDPLYVFTQYAERFVKAKIGDEVIGELDTNELYIWIERFVKMEHFKIEYSNLETVDNAIRSKMEIIDPHEQELINLKITEETSKIFALMGTDKNEGTITLTYRTNEGSKPKIIQ